MIAAIGTDGVRPVVWGLGATADEAIADAGDQEDVGEQTFVTVEVDAARVARIACGDVDASDLVVGEAIERLGGGR